MHIFKALADPTRRQIVEALAENETPLCICEIKESFDKDSSVLYRHIKKLEAGNVIQTRKDGRKLLCKVKHPDRIEQILNIAEELNHEAPDSWERMPEMQEA